MESRDAIGLELRDGRVFGRNWKKVTLTEVGLVGGGTTCGKAGALLHSLLKERRLDGARLRRRDVGQHDAKTDRVLAVMIERVARERGIELRTRAIGRRRGR